MACFFVRGAKKKNAADPDRTNNGFCVRANKSQRSSRRLLLTFFFCTFWRVRERLIDFAVVPGSVTGWVAGALGKFLCNARATDNKMTVHESD